MRRLQKLEFLCKRFYSSSASSVSVSNYLNRQITVFLTGQVINFRSLLQFHSYIITTGHTNNVFIASKLIAFYASLQLPNFSEEVFESVTFKDPFLWNSIIKVHFSNGSYSQALEFFDRMRVGNTLPDQFTVPMVVSAGAEMGRRDFGMKIHGLVAKLNLFYGNSAVGSSFVYMYSKRGSLGDACAVFDEISGRDVVAWTALVIGHVQNGESEKALERLCEMHKVGRSEERPNSRTMEGGFQSCGNIGALTEGRCLHAFALKSGMICSHVVQSSVLSMYSKCGTPEEAGHAFDETEEKDLLSWTSVISAYAKLEKVSVCFHMFLEMLAAGIHPDGMLLSCVIAGFGNSMKVPEGKAFHGLILRRDYIIVEMVHNALLSMYLKFGQMVLAEKLFALGGKWAKETCNLMIAGYNKIGSEVNCLALFREMQHRGIKYELNSMVSVISSCSRLGAIYLGRSLHCHILKMMIDDRVSVANVLIDMYGKCGKLGAAQKIFDLIERDTVSWNTLISSCNHNGQHLKALDLLHEMEFEGLAPNTATLVSLLSACSKSASLREGEQIHDYIKNKGFEYNLSLTTALIDMYAKCGKLKRSREIFDLMKEKDAISWNAMISGYGMHGDAKSAIQLFKQMECSNTRPNEVTFLALLSACTHAGYVEEGKAIFCRMNNYSLTPTLKHYACMTDLLGRSGYLHDAEALVSSMPTCPDGAIWGSLLNACKIHNDPEMGLRIAKLAIKSDPENYGYYIALSELYSSQGMWDEVRRVRKSVSDRKLRKEVGWSAV